MTHLRHVPTGNAVHEAPGPPAKPKPSGHDTPLRGKLAAALSFSGNVCALYFDSIASTSPNSRRVRSDIRNARFRARARIAPVSVSEFSQSFEETNDGWSQCTPLQLPPICMECDMGGAAYYATLAFITAKLQPKQVVEFGTYLGVATTIFATNASQSSILTIDLPDDPGDLSNLNSTDREHVQRTRNRVGQCYKGTPYEARIAELRADSRELVLRNHVRSADVILIDGGHDCSCVTKDTENAFAVAHPGTVIMWDDYFWLYPDVVGYLDRLADRRNLVRIEGTNIVGHVAR